MVTLGVMVLDSFMPFLFLSCLGYLRVRIEEIGAGLSKCRASFYFSGDVLVLKP